MRFFLLLYFLSIFAPAPSAASGKSLSEFERCRRQFVNSVSKSRTLIVKFVRETFPIGYKRAISQKGVIYYRKSPLALKLKLPDEKIVITGEKMIRYLRRYREKYVTAWDGSNPVLKFLNFPSGTVLDVKSEKNLVTFFVKRGEDRMKICYDKKKKFIKSVSVSGPVGKTVMRILEVERNTKLKKSAFKVNGSWKALDLRK